MRSTTHGARRNRLNTPEYVLWRNIKNRCLKRDYHEYQNYGGRGIKMCIEWQNDFQLFLAHVGMKPRSDYELDRIHNDGHYEPGNVRWTTRTQNQRNKRTNHVLEFQGRSMCLAEWAELLGINTHVLLFRLRRGWSVEKTLTTP